MAKKKTKPKSSKLVVIDADVAKSCSPPHSVHPSGTKNRIFLQNLMKICHRIVVTEELSEEYKKHASSFFRKWRVQMYARKKVKRVKSTSSLSARIAGLPDIEERAMKAMLKDVHLIDAALCGDGVVISMDETAKGYFASVVENNFELKRVRWLNPKEHQASDISSDKGYLQS